MNSARHASRAPSAMRCARASSSASPASTAAAAEQPCRPVQERRRDDAVIGRRIRPRRHAGLEPFAEVEPGVPEELLVRRRHRAATAARSGCRDPAAARRAYSTHPHIDGQSPPESVEVAVVAPELPRHEHRGIPPAGGPGRHVLEDDARRPVAGGIGDDGRHAAVRPLVGGEVVEPLRRERLDVVEQRGGVDEHLPVAGEPGALALRTVGRDVARVAAGSSGGRARAGRRGARRCRRTSPTGRRSAVHDDGARRPRHPTRSGTPSICT